MNSNIQFIQYSPEQLVTKLSSDLKSQLKDIIENLKPCEKEVLTRDETIIFLGIDQSTLWEWTKQGKVQAYGIGGRRYYKKSELINALIPIQSKRKLTINDAA
ncbi:helix-turn-helix domain-containing protein [Flavobacterium sp. AG291]|uniref:helix-turn-helix domain-containing protein n=1 Tax=Flavobacterium sp. AG291 TaxID=2184000 RepID=UPI000E0A0BC6|nr:helix-turn-helix domain-containing protein [Flavobacterium sp. AG291]RDI10246.1 helix-turn-helix protein [Flavobacterium sp. AG291]